MKSRALIESCLLTILNASLRFRGIHRTKVARLSNGYKTAWVTHWVSENRSYSGLVPVEVLLSEDYEGRI